MSKAVMQQALEALEGLADYRYTDRVKNTMASLRQALAEPEQEPVAWAVYDILHGGSKTLHWPEQHSPNGDPKQYKAVPLYTAPTPRKPLTDEEIVRICVECWRVSPRDIFFARAIERAHGIGGEE